MKLWLTLLCGLLLLATGCSGGDDSRGDAANADPARVLNDAVAAVQKVSSFHFNLTHENGTTPIPLSLELVSAEGDVVTPDRLSAKVNAKAAGAINVSVNVIGVGAKTWVTNPFTRNWQILPGATLKDIADPAALAATLVEEMQDAKIAGEATVDGESTWHLTGTLQSAVLAAAIAFADPGHTVNVDVWIAKDDSLPRRGRITGPLASSEPANIVRQVDFTRFNASDIQISAPE